jgi:hypothetical protein
MVAVGAQWSWFCACGFFRSKGSARVRDYDKLGNQDLIDDSVSTQNIETGFVSSTGMFNRKKSSDWVGARRVKAAFVELLRERRDGDSGRA